MPRVPRIPEAYAGRHVPDWCTGANAEPCNDSIVYEGQWFPGMEELPEVDAVLEFRVENNVETFRHLGQLGSAGTCYGMNGTVYVDYYGTDGHQYRISYPWGEDPLKLGSDPAEWFDRMGNRSTRSSSRGGFGDLTPRDSAN